jgi:hypothetical protein
MATAAYATGSAGSTTPSSSLPSSSFDLSGLLKTLTTDYEETRTAKQKRYDEGIGILQSIVEQFGPGYLKGEETKTLAAMEQGMVGRGLGGTTRPAAVGTGIKADIRDRQTRARTGAMTNVANFMAGFQDLAPTPGTLAHLATGGFSGLLQQAIAGAPGGPLGPMQTGSGGTFYERNISGGGGSNMALPLISGGGSSGSGSSGTGGTVTGAGAATYGLGGGMDAPLGGGGGSYAPQIGDYMDVEQGPGSPILGGGGLQSWEPEVLDRGGYGPQYAPGNVGEAWEYPRGR